MSDAVNALMGRQSIREFAPGEISDGEWAHLVRAAQQCSTDATGQMYCAIEVRDASKRRQIAEWAGMGHVGTAPRFLVVCLDTHRLRLLLEHRGEKRGILPTAALLFGITDAALFGQSLALAAESRGYGTCFIGGIQNQGPQVADLLGCPEGVVPLWGLTIGRPLHTPRPKPRLPTPLIVHVDAYQEPTKDELSTAFSAMAPATRSGDWLNSLKKYFAPGGIMAEREADLRKLLASRGFPLETPFGQPNP